MTRQDPGPGPRWDASVAREWESVKPGLAAEIWDEFRVDERHRRRMAWAAVAQRAMGQVFALTSVGAMLLFAKYSIDAGEPLVAAFAVGAPSISLAVIFGLSRMPGRTLESGLSRPVRRITAVTAAQQPPPDAVSGGSTGP
ncbi:hypothetical protein TUSST3_02980 [Streptomyces sp. TUS-ST3]|jgi:hypothetical protein|uniref:hypothetical protein n=1 Tax=Streptomyces sp. TUS-ST3 TaxID=3025591 RepID=UPI00235B4C78|nr:hypothetical protein [Streptomyces sp. TUS-ST3]GLP63677.1 hypothetical protein TUSST3_02980 [Streptomyces sp. TUS-ST3]